MIQIINTGVANIRSLQAAFDRLGCAWDLTVSAEEIESASHIVLPGVGAFAAATQSIDQLGLRNAIIDRINRLESPTLCICLGMQLLCESSEESKLAKGLGIIPHAITRFGDKVKIPQLGWNEVRPLNNGPFTTGEAYFANSYRLKTAPVGWGAAETNYGGKFISSIWRGRTLACQFHPELSGIWGESVLTQWIEGITC